MTTNEADRARWIERHGPLVAACLFLVAGLVFLGSSAHFHGDERYYTDSALRMLELGDAWTPRWADGSVRANKPLFTYWVVLAGFASGGVSFFVARLPFLLAGTLLVWLTGRLAQTLFPTIRAAPLLASLIVACDYEVVSLARRSTPDILLMLFTAASLFGLARLVVRNERSTAAAAWFWLGGALAIATKGGLGVVVLVFGTVLLFAMRERAPLRRAFPISVCLLALVIALVGLAPSFFSGVSASSTSFVDDQVGGRFAGSFSEVGRQMLDYGTSLAKHFLPWVLFVAVGAFALRDTFRERLRAHKTAILLAVIWAALLWLVFSFSNTHRGRYLAPAHALLAAAIAPFVLDVARTRWGRRSAWTLGLALVAISTCAAVLVARVDIATGAALCAPLVLFVVGTRVLRDDAAAFRGLALALLAATTIAYESLLALVDPSPLPRVVAALERGDEVVSRGATLGLPDTVAGQLRVLSGGRLDLRAFPDSVPDSELSNLVVILADEQHGQRLRHLGYEIERLPQSAANLDLRRAKALFWEGESLEQTLFVGPALGIARAIGTFR